MKYTIKKMFDVNGKLVLFFDDDILPQVTKTGSTDLGNIEIIACENGHAHSFSAVVSTKIPKENLEGLVVSFLN